MTARLHSTVSPRIGASALSPHKLHMRVRSHSFTDHPREQSQPQHTVRPYTVLHLAPQTSVRTYTCYSLPPSCKLAHEPYTKLSSCLFNFVLYRASNVAAIADCYFVSTIHNMTITSSSSPWPSLTS